MGASFTSTSGTGIFSNPELFMASLRAKIFAAMEIVVKAAVEDMQRSTSTRKNVISGDMLAAIGGKTFFEGVNRVIGEFGFENSQQLYYILQSGNQPAGGVTGFHHYPDGKFIESSFAMRDAYVHAIEILIAQLNILRAG